LVLQDGEPIPHLNGSGDTFDPGGREILGLDSDKRGGMGKQFRAHPAADRRVHGQHAVTDEPEQQWLEEVPCRRTLDAERDMAGFPPRQPCRMTGCHLEGDLGSRVARPDDEDSSISKLGRVPVFGRVQLEDGGIKLGCEHRHPGLLMGGHGHHHVVGLEPPLAGRHHERFLVRGALGQPVHLDPGSHRQVEPRRVALEVVGHLVLGRERVGRAGEGHSVQTVVAGGGEQAKRVPTVPPGVADPLVGVQDHEGQPTPGQVIPDRESRLAAADDHRLETLGAAAVVHRFVPIPRSQ